MDSPEKLEHLIFSVSNPSVVDDRVEPEVSDDVLEDFRF